MDRSDRRFLDDGCIYDENGSHVSPLDNDYGFYKAEQEAVTDPLSDDYCKYDD